MSAAFSRFVSEEGSAPGSFFTSSTTSRMRSFSILSSRTMRLSSSGSSGSAPAAPGVLSAMSPMKAAAPSSDQALLQLRTAGLVTPRSSATRAASSPASARRTAPCFSCASNRTAGLRGRGASPRRRTHPASAVSLG